MIIKAGHVHFDQAQSKLSAAERAIKACAELLVWSPGWGSGWELAGHRLSAYPCQPANKQLALELNVKEEKCCGCPWGFTGKKHKKVLGDGLRQGGLPWYIGICDPQEWIKCITGDGSKPTSDTNRDR